MKEGPQAKRTEVVPLQPKNYRAELELLAACASYIKDLPGSRSEFDVLASLAYETNLSKFGVTDSPVTRPPGPRDYRAELDALDYDGESVDVRSSLIGGGFCGFIRAPTLWAFGS
jgi:hypothetical protein